MNTHTALQVLPRLCLKRHLPMANYEALRRWLKKRRINRVRRLLAELKRLDPCAYLNFKKRAQLRIDLAEMTHLCIMAKANQVASDHRHEVFRRAAQEEAQAARAIVSEILQEATARTTLLERAVEDLQADRERWRRQAGYDSLTQLFNRRGLEERFQVAYSTLSHGMRLDEENRHYPTISALMIDVDHFKRINDRYGHPVGDQVLKTVADLIRAHYHGKRPSDIFCRWGGEEFLVILPQSGADFAYQEAALLGQEFRSATILSGEAVTVSIGVADMVISNPTMDTPDDFLSRLTTMADQALYVAKRKDSEGTGDHPGRDRAIRWQPHMAD